MQFLFKLAVQIECMKNSAIITKFENSILSVRFLNNAVITLDDMKELYEYGNMHANGRPYCALFEAVGHYEVMPDAIEYFSVGNPNDTNILAKAYVVGENKEASIKSKVHLLFNQPKIEPRVFTSHTDARNYLDAVVMRYNIKE